MAGEILDGAFAFAVLAIDRWLQNFRPRRPGAFELAVHVFRPYLDHVRNDVGLRRLPLACHVRNDHGPVRADAQLRPMAFADSCSLDEAEGHSEPVHRRPHVG